MKRIILIVLSVCMAVLNFGCEKNDKKDSSSKEEVIYERYKEAEFKEAKIGKYYVDGDTSSEYIEIIEGNKLQFVNYNKDEFAEILELYLSNFEFSDEKQKEELHSDFQERLLSPYEYYIKEKEGMYVLIIDNFCKINGSYMEIKYDKDKEVLILNNKEYIYCEE